MKTKNWFSTMNESLESENLGELWPAGEALEYNETKRITVEDGSEYGHLISISRNNEGMYERPTHYQL